jgi:hypothetical protein
VLPHSFSDYEEYVQGDEIIAQYPYARREMLKEIVVLCPIIMGFVVGFMIGYERGFPPLLVQVLGGSMLGYLVGGGLVWGIRILGTLGFGREAMGLGDVHLLAGVGAVVGWWDPILIFFIAPFSGLLWAASTAILAKMGKKSREIPYGPHLAIATLVVVFLRPGLNWAWTIAMPGVLQPSIENVQIIKSGDDFISMRIFVEYLQGMDLTDGLKEGSIPISPHVVGCDRVRQDVSLVCGL